MADRHLHPCTVREPLLSHTQTTNPLFHTIHPCQRQWPPSCVAQRTCSSHWRLRARRADFPGYHSPDRALVGDEERTAHAMAIKRLAEATAKPTR